jgi:endonuclease YncB( thermonuclease family)
MANFSPYAQANTSADRAYGCCFFGIIVAVFAAAWYVLKYAFRAAFWLMKYVFIAMYYGIAAPFLLFEFLWRRGGMWRPLLMVGAGLMFLVALVLVLTAPSIPAKPAVVATATGTASPTVANTETPVPATPTATVSAVPTATLRSTPRATQVATAEAQSPTPIPPEAPTATVAAAVAPQPTSGDERIAAFVSSVTDGDTVRLNYEGTVQSIRMIGVDTPETRDPRKPVQCYGAEASRFTKEMLLKQNVTISFDETQGIRDKYDRLLVYIWLPDGRLFNQLLISEGYAFEYTYNLPYKYQAEFIAAENDARVAQRGLWATTSCNGVASPVTPTP